jgi:superoxide dismutase, Fe-Mn family
MKHELPALPYDMEALAPTISKETLEYHWGKHHRTYVDNLNKMIEGTPFANSSLEDIIRRAEGGIFNNGAQVWNHTFYWNSLHAAKTGPQNPDGKLLEQIQKDFGGYDQFKEQFSKAAIGQFGSGWAWLVKDSGKLTIVATPNAENPLRQGKTPILTCDVWEHAYYIDYRNARAKYVEGFWNLVNWDFAKKNFERA